MSNIADTDTLVAAARTLGEAYEGRQVNSDQMKRRDLSRPMAMVRPNVDAENTAACTLGKLVAFDAEAMAEAAFWSMVVTLLPSREVVRQAGIKEESRALRIEYIPHEPSVRMAVSDLIDRAADTVEPFGASLMVAWYHGSVELSVAPVAEVWAERAKRYGAAVRLSETEG